MKRDESTYLVVLCRRFRRESSADRGVALECLSDPPRLLTSGEDTEVLGNEMT